MDDRFGQAKMVGESASLRRAIELLDGAAKSPSATVLLEGEFGTGKELMARYLHWKSSRAGGPFIVTNCSAIPETMLESELFGQERAITTGGHFKARLEHADAGTLFLDEIGEMAPSVQAKFLRFLETLTFRRVGGHADIRVDVRFVAATRRDLERQIADGKFREDLYHRLNVVPVQIPPLRQRPEDIRPLAEHFIGKVSAELGRIKARLHPDALRAMLDYSWPGNVRELENVIERVLLLETPDEIRLEHLPAELRGPSPSSISRQTLRTKLKEYQMGDDTEPGEGELADQ